MTKTNTMTKAKTKTMTKTLGDLKEQLFLRLVTFETSDQSDEET